jgi:DNA-binding NtrC family response regulator
VTKARDRVLVVEDEAPQRALLKAFLERSGLAVEAVGDVPSARAALSGGAVDAVVTDFQMPGGTGLDVLKAARDADPALGVVLVTAFGTVPMAVEAMRAGAFDVLLKPVDPDALLRVLERSLAGRALARENESLRARLGERVAYENVVAESGAMQAVLAIVRRVAPTNATVLVTGESGTGKELVANLLHAHGKRPKGPFVAVNTAALPEGLLESELFGHAKGSFTGATKDRAGRFEDADGGTIFLDEIGEVPAAVQVRLLRVLQERTVTRVGENGPRAVDARVVAATNKDIEAEVKAGRFREDLYYRLNVVRVHLPPLRARREDVPPLVARFAAEAARRNGAEPVTFSREAIEALTAMPFPGNVRELQNVVERAVLLSPRPVVRAEDLPTAWSAPHETSLPDGALPLEKAVEELERRMIRAALHRAHGVQTKAAEALGIGERVLRYKLSKYGIDRA